MNTRSTVEYDMFKRRKDNRKEISRPHVNYLKTLIQRRNLLHLHPIMVNFDMEVVNGNHRLMAARELSVPIYYDVVKDVNPQDVIMMNTMKPWGIADYHNFYVENGFPEYKKLDDWMVKRGLGLKSAVIMTSEGGSGNTENFRRGEYIFSADFSEQKYEWVLETCEIIKASVSYNAFITSGKFVKALNTLFSDHVFNFDQWKKNLGRFIGRICAKATLQDYIRLFQEIYNWRMTHRVNLLNDKIME